MSELLRCTTAFWVGNTLIQRGQVLAADHPLVTPGRRRFFEAYDPLRGVPVVERATRAPGEVRPAVNRTQKPIRHPGARPKPAAE